MPIRLIGCPLALGALGGCVSLTRMRADLLDRPINCGEADVDIASGRTEEDLRRRISEIETECAASGPEASKATKPGTEG